ncbi:unnamed protein product [Ascophyllum nodosum]
MDDDVDAGPLTTPIWTLDDLQSNFGTTLEMLNEVTLKHPHAEFWLRETSNTQNACIGGASMNVRLLFSRFADNLQIRDVLPSSAERIAKSLLTTRGFVVSCTPVVCVMKKGGRLLRHEMKYHSALGEGRRKERLRRDPAVESSRAASGTAESI